jgi:4-hydroxy-tetrahydrodipicolinate synthase
MKTLLKIMGRVAVPPVTPFTEAEDVDFDGLSRLLDAIIRKDFCDSLILTGTTAEFYTMSDEERIEVWRAGLEAVRGRARIVAGIGATSTRTTVRLAKVAEELGVDVLMAVLPYYSKPTQEGIERHFEAVSAAVSLPIMLYNIPLFTGVNLEPATLEHLVTHCPNIVGIKEEAGIAPTQATAYALCTPPEFSIYCGDDTMVLQVLQQGGVGVVSGGSAVIGDWMKAMIAAWLGDDNSRATAIYFRLARFFRALNQNGRINPIPILRAAIELGSGIRIGPPRRPQMRATSEEIAVIRPILEGLGGGVPLSTDSVGERAVAPATS